MDRIIALALGINQLMQEIKDTSDDPDVLYKALQTEAAALMLQKTSVDYRPRLQQLKALEGRRNGVTVK